MNHEKAYLCYWGKSQSLQLKADNSQYHLLAYHCLDVAAVGEALLAADALWRRRLERLAGPDAAAVASLAVFLFGLHDLGKFATSFQDREPDLARRLGAPPFPGQGRTHHVELGSWLLGRLAGEWEREGFLLSGLRERKRFLALAAAALGHHGAPARDVDCADHFVGTRVHAAAFARDLAGLLLPQGFRLPGLDRQLVKTLSWLLAGLCVLADWIGSNREWFPFCPDASDLESYWHEQARPLARAAVERCGILGPEPAGARPFAELFPHLADRTPTPLQQHAADLESPGPGPQLHVFEDLTGSGKTEAALLAAQGLMAAGEAAGLYVGLPTMATANAMYARLAESYRNLFAPGSRPSLMLAHGARSLHDEFLGSIRMERPAPASESDDGASACAAWLADGRKKALLAPCGAGTLDQALLGVLPSRHQSLRLLGLCRNVLVADEVHAYDAYTMALLCGLLRFQAGLGGSAVLLSATLPLAARQRLVDAFCEGADLPLRQVREESFPLATRVSLARGLEETPLPARGGKDVAVRLIQDPAEAVAELAAVRRAGGCGCWLRNTVDDVLAARDLVSAAGIPDADVLVFHARFTAGDRADIEARVLEWFGSNSDQKVRSGKILLASQVAEQSLDLDFDFLATDLAPMELMIQRAGRCCRHDRGGRPEGFGQARMLVLGPEPDENPPADWYGRMFEKGKWVYPVQAQLWRTARLLRDRGALRLPGDARDLVEASCGRGLDAPAVFDRPDARPLGEARAKTAMAERNALEFGQGYSLEASGTEWLQDLYTPTRLGEVTVQLRLLRVEQGEVRLWTGDAASARDCALSEVRAREWLVNEPAIPLSLAPAVEVLREQMPDKGKWSVLVPLRPGPDGTWIGPAQRRDDQGKITPVTVAYEPGCGVRVVKGLT
ncbi:MAG: CRISPR-associated helicase Cas3' [Thermodesulfobacteriota bacterium]